MAILAAGVAAAAVLTVYQPASSTIGASGTGNSGSSGSSLPGGGSFNAPTGGSGTSASEQAVVNKIEPGLVFINTNLQYDSEAAAGTGMVINSDGLVLTNNHVIEGSTKITATIVSTGQTFPAKVVGYDKTGDVALIKLTGASGLHTVPLGNVSSIHVGSSVVAMGNAGGQSSIVPAAGEIVGTDKTIKAIDDGGTATSETLHGMLKTDADIVSGDSGGPLASTAGVVIGMDTAGNSSNDVGQTVSPTGFAIPINTALSIAQQIAAGHGSSTITIGYPPFVGIFVAPGSSSNPQTQAQQQEQQQNGFGGVGGFGSGQSGGGSGQSCYASNADLVLPTKIAPVTSGSLVDGAICGSPAATAGLIGGSVITAVNGQPVGAPDNLTSTLAKFHPGNTISVAWVSPSGQHHTSSIQLIVGPPQ